MAVAAARVRSLNLKISFLSSNHENLKKPTNLTLLSPHSTSAIKIQSLTIKSSATSPTTATEKSSNFRVDILSESLPYIQKFWGKTIVVEYGDAAMKVPELKESVVGDLVFLSCVGLRPILVHGGGPEISNFLLNIEPVSHDGLRVTDAKKMEIVSMGLVGKVNKDLVSLINKVGDTAVTAVGLSGMDGRLLVARPNLGIVDSVDTTILQPLLNSGFIPVIAPVAADKSGQPYNINADTVAGEIAAALGAEKLILLTDVPGILKDINDPNSLVKEIDIKGVGKLIEENKVAGGMIPKVNCCLRSLAQGVRTASIIDGRVEHSLLHELMSEEGIGTMITV